MNAGVIYAVKILSIPAAILIFGYTYFNRVWLTSLNPSQSWRPWLMALGIYLIFLLLGWAYFLAINTLVISDTPVIFSGQVLDKFISSSRISTSHHIKILDDDSKTPITLYVTRNEYSKIKIGENYSKCFQKGRLGIPFLWRDSSIPYSCWKADKKHS
jgi:hypothetical protein